MCDTGLILVLQGAILVLQGAMLQCCSALSGSVDAIR